MKRNANHSCACAANVNSQHRSSCSSTLCESVSLALDHRKPSTASACAPTHSSPVAAAAPQPVANGTNKSTHNTTHMCVSVSVCGSYTKGESARLLRRLTKETGAGRRCAKQRSTESRSRTGSRTGRPCRFRTEQKVPCAGRRTCRRLRTAKQRRRRRRWRAACGRFGVGTKRKRRLGCCRTERKTHR
jgi:hypothetical protein